ncbi:hypothetical protein ABB37_03464 [Leptomonas pyrrhocoris]|uniref:Cilia- and flagella-associated protein 418 n=1 Tax=Leptomonas pyrrhocoris TaxID=157538 RepID=A0A0M9G584_LEPPY|nr:hypothetical protein ABB37_03464 [Leptomonas pyrrhocoris]KPA82386.1 hypothetical protein ABB37_03464 [Leptomonas pyrrhocoris]|eukprot:XP_015660825.1 hypothetical protein ABB37_03464 [Leptomonas pyrrhocoris]
MSGAGVDDLIGELFPDKAKKKNPVHKASGAPPPPHRRQSEWDDDSDNESGVPTNAHVSGGVGVARSSLRVANSPISSSATAAHPTTTTSATTTAAVRHSVGHAFDDDTSEDEGDANVKRNSTAVDGHGAASSPIRNSSGVPQPDAPTLRGGVSSPVIHPVPFPSLSDSDGAFSCAPRCYLTNRGAALCGAATHPTLQQLRALATNELAIAASTRAQAMVKKGAFHAVVSKLGNGCLDHHGDCTNDGGCPHILCHRCNYMVVRLQGAEWEDAHGRVNLYLTLRNFYPDWCRLANATPVGVEDGQRSGQYVLKVNPATAAYCCQCSWVTMKSAKAVIETKLTDAFLVKSESDGSHPFATEMPLVHGEKRRPPLWVCHGHPQ